MKVVNRIKKSEDFALTINNGVSRRFPSYSLFARKTDIGYTRVGISASKKWGNAVVRNRAKRQVRAICDQVIDYNQQSLDIVVIIKNKFLDESFDNNKSQICDFMKGLLKWKEVQK